MSLYYITLVNDMCLSNVLLLQRHFSILDYFGGIVGRNNAQNKLPNRVKLLPRRRVNSAVRGRELAARLLENSKSRDRASRSPLGAVASSRGKPTPQSLEKKAKD